MWLRNSLERLRHALLEETPSVFEHAQVYGCVQFKQSSTPYSLWGNDQTTLLGNWQKTDMINWHQDEYSNKKTKWLFARQALASKCVFVNAHDFPSAHDRTLCIHCSVMVSHSFWSKESRVRCFSPACFFFLFFRDVSTRLAARLGSFSG